MFFLGFSGVGRCSISFLYLMELLPQEKGTFYGTIVQMNNNMAYIYVALYFWLISIDWRWLEVFAIGMTLFCIIGSLFIPESPKFYLSKKRWDDARKSLSSIARFNRLEPFNRKFDRENF